ncbi:unnamed protein product, partial [Mesorhabditis spiculigera]
MITVVRPYEPPPDYPLGDERETKEDIRSASDTQSRQRTNRGYRPASQTGGMLRTRQYPEVAGLYGGEDQAPALRRFTRYNQSLSHRDHTFTLSEQPSTITGNSKKSPFAFNNWTFREKKPIRGAIPFAKAPKREERPASVNLTDLRGSRSRSEGGRFLEGFRESGDSSTRPDIGCRIPIRVDRTLMQENVRPGSNRVLFRSQPPPLVKNVIHDQNVHPPAVTTATTNSPESNDIHLRKSCPSLNDSVAIGNLGQHRVSTKKNRRKERVREGWRNKPLKEWHLNDILLWLQAIGLDDVASLLVGYDLKGTDLETWDHASLTQLGISQEYVRSKIMMELRSLALPNERTESSDRQSSMFDLVRNTAFDQVLAFETSLTPRDLSATAGRLGCLQVTKVDGSRLPLKENDCLLEINGLPGEHFKSALMLTKLISVSDGKPIRFVVLRRKASEGRPSDESYSSSGVSSSPINSVTSKNL